jgi:rhamnosyl/mannosyltransferase
VPLGVDQTRFRPGSGQSGADAELLFVGRLRHYKGLDVLLRALAALPDIRLRVIGEGPMGDEWQALAGSLGLRERVAFEGRIPDDALPAYYRRASIFVLPSTSRAEAFGTVLLEAMASGLPCVTTELGTGTSWVVRHGETGLVVPASDDGVLRDAIARLIADPAIADAMGAAGRRRIESRFTEAAMVDRVSAIYETLQGGAERRPPAGRERS